MSRSASSTRTATEPGPSVAGTRVRRKAILFALLDPTGTPEKLELEGKKAEKPALMEEMMMMPFDAVWNYLCLKEGPPPAGASIDETGRYEETGTNKERERRNVGRAWLSFWSALS